MANGWRGFGFECDEGLFSCEGGYIGGGSVWRWRYLGLVWMFCGAVALFEFSLTWFLECFGEGKLGGILTESVHAEQFDHINHEATQSSQIILNLSTTPTITYSIKISLQFPCDEHHVHRPYQYSSLAHEKIVSLQYAK